MGEEDSSTNRQSFETEKAIANQPTSPNPIMVFETQDSSSSLCSPQDSIRTDIITKLQDRKLKPGHTKWPYVRVKGRLKFFRQTVQYRKRLKTEKRDLQRPAYSNQICAFFTVLPVTILKIRC
ncbi:hypothetical protein Peur_012057 [Populus x canadensis]